MNESPLRNREARVDLSRTWEMELLISGAIVFALMKVPPVVAQRWDRFEPHLAGLAHYLGFLAYYYLSLIVYTLIVTFIAHLILRAYWVGIIGLHSVFPGGVQWDRASYGDVGRRVVKPRVVALGDLIQRVDDICSVLFAAGSVIVLTFLMSIVLTAIVALLAFVLGTVLDVEGGERAALIGLLIIVFLPTLIVGLDKPYAHRFREAGLMHRIIAWNVRFMYYAFFAFLYAPISLVLFTNVRKRVIYPVMFAVLGSILVVFMATALLPRSSRLRITGHTYETSAAMHMEVNAVHYRDMAGREQGSNRVPTIQSSEIGEPYIKLFVPIIADRHFEVVALKCPAVGQQRRHPFMLRPDSIVAADSAAITRYVSCLTALQPVSLDGRPLTDLPFRLYTDPTTGTRGILAHIPTAGLAPGEHVLRVEGLPRVRDNKEQERRAPNFIRFWI